mmetsp:Transcript_6179/g.11220  ORF Transcript_6179/g.11220 Transcript_6179/m.11220 type:complete len:233 (-) Transcript_6179:300-998(-)
MGSKVTSPLGRTSCAREEEIAAWDKTVGVDIGWTIGGVHMLTFPKYGTPGIIAVPSALAKSPPASSTLLCINSLVLGGPLFLAGRYAQVNPPRRHVLQDGFRESHLTFLFLQRTQLLHNFVFLPRMGIRSLLGLVSFLVFSSVTFTVSDVAFSSAAGEETFSCTSSPLLDDPFAGNFLDPSMHRLFVLPFSADSKGLFSGVVSSLPIIYAIRETSWWRNHLHDVLGNNRGQL